MTKKKIPTKETNFSGDPTQEPIEVRIDFDSIKPKKVVLNKDEIAIDKIRIKPIGYPIKLMNAQIPDGDTIVIPDSDLFQAYASDQWAGLSVREQEYLFDQMVLPDFAFKILEIQPKNATRITLSTDFIVEIEKKPEIKITPIGFDDIVGNKQAKDKCSIIAECLKSPDKFGEWIPKNILFYGYPGTGKTLTARALASTTNAKIFIEKGTSLIGLHVGEGASKIHRLYMKARQYAPSIIFIDEIDAIGLSRSYQNVRGDVIEVATALLAEMDGIEDTQGVITIAATNNIDLLDPGLRSRFEEEIKFDLPNKEERIDLLKLYLSKAPGLKHDVNLPIIAQATEGLSGRDIKEKIVKNAIYNVIRNKSDTITTADMMNIIDKIRKKQKTHRLYS